MLAACLLGVSALFFEVGLGHPQPLSRYLYKLKIIIFFRKARKEGKG